MRTENSLLKAKNGRLTDEVNSKSKKIEELLSPETQVRNFLLFSSIIYFVFLFTSQNNILLCHQLISWASVGRIWIRNLAIPRWCYQPLYHSSIVDQLHVTRECPMPRGTKLFIVLSSERVLTEHSYHQWRVFNPTSRRAKYSHLRTSLFCRITAHELS